MESSFMVTLSGSEEPYDLYIVQNFLKISVFEVRVPVLSEKRYLI